jgi:hypothetical protein
MASAKSAEPIIFRTDGTVDVPPGRELSDWMIFRKGRYFYNKPYPRKCVTCGARLMDGSGKTLKDHRPFGQYWRCVEPCSRVYLDRLRQMLRDRARAQRTGASA